MEDASGFSWTTWGPADIATAAADAIAAREAALTAVKVIAATERTFANTIGALDRISGAYADVQQIVEFLMEVHPEAAVRGAAHTASETMNTANIAVAHDRGIWDAVQAWEATGQRQSLTGADRKLADDTLRDLRRTGFHLPEDVFAELRAGREELQKLETDFERAIGEWDDGIVVTREQLAGIPERVTEGFARTDDGRYRVSLRYPDLFPFLELADDDDARRELAAKNLRKGGPENMARLARMVALRAANAATLGYPSHAEYRTEPRMAGNAAAVGRFLERIIRQLHPAAAAQLKELVFFKKEQLGLEHPKPIHFHEVGYWQHRLRKAKFGLDSEELKAYFPLPRVLEGMLALYQELLGVRFARRDDLSLWHPSVSCWSVTDAASGRHLGHFFLDLHPRTGKFGHAASFPLRLADGAPSMGLVCNFPEPTSSAPALLDHEEVETLLHEFGHVMHAILSGGGWPSQNGYGVAWDFVEALSQIFEYWTWHADGLAKISGHWQTGAPLPREMLDKMQAARAWAGPMYYLNQAVRSLYDLRVHSEAPRDALQLAALHRDMRLTYESIDLPDDAIFPAGWGHMADYDAAYYGYLWSKVYAADMFTRFAPAPLDPAAGAAYRKQVLEPGASRTELDLVRDFLGREPSDAAFLAELGIS